MYMGVLHENLSCDHVSSVPIEPIRVALSVARLTREPRSRARYQVRLYTFVSTPADPRRAVVSYWQKFVHLVVVNSLGGLRLPRNSVVRLTDRPEMTITVYLGRRAKTQLYLLL